MDLRWSKVSKEKLYLQVIPEFVNYLRSSSLILLDGEVGNGKTTFVQNFCSLLEIQDKVLSPTFNLMELYSGVLHKKKIFVYHCDFYRLSNNSLFEELYELQQPCIIFIEWFQNIKINWMNFAKQNKLDYIVVEILIDWNHPDITYSKENFTENKLQNVTRNYKISISSNT